MADSLRNALDVVLTFLPKLLLAAIIVAVGYFIAKALEKLLVKILEKVGFDRAVERGGIKKALQSSSYDAAQILAKIVFYAVMLFVLSTAFGVFGPNPISDYLAAIIGYLPKVFVAILILVIAAAVAAAVRLLVQNALGSLSYATVLAGAAGTLVLALGIIAALDQLQIAQNVVNAVLYAVLVAVVGVVVVAVGGGGIVPMRQRWENALAKVEAEAPNVREAARSASEVLQEETDRLAAQRQETGTTQQAQAEPAAPPVLPYGQPITESYQPTEAYDQQSLGQPYDQQATGTPAYPPVPEYAQPEGATRYEPEPYPADQYASEPATQYPAEQYPAEQYPAEQYPADQYAGEQYTSEQQVGEQYGGEQYGAEQRDGDGQYGEQYGSPQPWSTGSIPVPDPQQAYPQPPVPTTAEEPQQYDEPGTAQLPRITDDTPPHDTDERPR